MKENKVAGRAYRVLTDSVNDIWDRISFWTKASDIEFDDGSVLEGKVFGHSILERDKKYAVGDIAYCNEAPSWVILRCTNAGTTAIIEPTNYKNITTPGESVTDGTAVFTADDHRLATALSASDNQAASVGLVKSTAEKIRIYVGSDGKLHFTNSAGADSALNFKVHDATYTFPANDTGATKDLGELHKYRYVNAANVYAKGKADGVTTHTTTYTFPSGDKGAKRDLGVNHTYRYVNAENVYNKGVTDADARTNTASTNYKSGYNQGVSDADGRTNASSANYKAGYNAGVSYADGRANSSSANYKAGVAYADGRVSASAASYQAGVQAGKDSFKIWSQRITIPFTGPTLSTGINIYLKNIGIYGKNILAFYATDEYSDVQGTCHIWSWYNTDYDGATSDNPAIHFRIRADSGTLPEGGNYTFWANIAYFE